MRIHFGSTCRLGRWNIGTLSLLFHLAKHLLYTKFRDPGEEPKLALFGQLKRITKQWLDGGHLRCSGGTFPAQLAYQEIADMAAERIKAAIVETLAGHRPVKAILDAYNPTGSTAFVNFNTSKADRWKTDPRYCHINWVVCDSDWEAEFCRIAESTKHVRAYVKNHNLGLEVPYLMGSEPKKYRPDFIVQIDDGRPDPLNLIVETKGYRGEDAIAKANTMNAYWVPGVNNLGKFGRWAFVEYAAVYEMEAAFTKLVDEVRIVDSLLMARGKDNKRDRPTLNIEVAESRAYLGLLPPTFRDDLHRLATQLQDEIGNDVLLPKTTKRKKS